MTPSQFHYLLNELRSRISKTDTTFRKSIDPGLKLALTLRFLAAGDSQVSLSYAYRVSKSSVTLIIGDVLDALWDCFHKKFLPTPSPEDWAVIATRFKERWNFPNCIGALDGKHVAIQCPANSGSQFYNYKQFHIVILMAHCL